MVCKSTFVAGALLVLAAAASPASAVTVGPHSVAPVAEDSLVQLNIPIAAVCGSIAQRGGAGATHDSLSVWSVVVAVLTRRSSHA